MSSTITYKGETIGTASNSTLTLETEGTWLEDDITIVDVTSGGGGAVIEPLSVTENGTYTAPSGVDGYSPVTVNVAGASGWDGDDVASRTSMTGAVTCSTATKLMPWCFAYTGITSFSSDTVINIENTDSQGNMFNRCTSLTSVSIPNVTTQIGTSAFFGCTLLQTINMPNALTGMVNVFNGCASLQEATFTKSTAVGNSFFFGCSSLAKVDLSSSTISTNGAINANAFKDCSSLKTIILRKSTIFTLGATSAFNGTPFANGGTGGTIYVPSALISTYQAASNWSTINGYGTITWKAIEGSQYE